MASTALLQFEIDLPLIALAKKIGVPAAQRAWRLSVSAVQALAHIVREERIRCDFQPRRSLYLAGTAYGSRALRAEVDARTDAGIDGRFVKRNELLEHYGIDRTGAIESPGSASANPAQLTAALLRRCITQGARIYAPADVQAVATDQAGVMLALASGPVIRATTAIFCTGYELLKAMPLDGHAVKSTWAIATHPLANLPSWIRSTLVWEASNPYLYIRATSDGRILAGGEDEDSGTRHADRATLLHKSRTIVRQLEGLLPSLSLRVSHRWAGAFGESPTGLPIIDAVPGLPHCYSATGFGGNGITHSVIAAKVIVAALTGTPDVDADLFRAPSARTQPR